MNRPLRRATPVVLIFFCLITSVRGAQSAPPDFETEILPILTKAGCNAGACHGAAAGRGEFRLSLWGADPDSDYNAIVHAYENRRINTSAADLSLLYLKPTAALKHGGGLALDPDGPGAVRLLAWIDAGAPRASATPRRLKQLTVTPQHSLSTQIPARIRLHAHALFESERIDVTPRTIFQSPDASAVTIGNDAEGTYAEAHRRGQHTIIARYLDRIVPIRWIIPFHDQAPDLSQVPRTNFLDDEILRVLAELHLPASPPADDAAFHRRVRWDLTGRLPTPEETRAFLSDGPALGHEKRARLVEELLAIREYTDLWTLRYARLLRVHGIPNENEGVRAYVAWIREQIHNDAPWDVVGRELLTATGDAFSVGPANFGRMTNDARGQAELVGRIFLGARLGCANCHNHPLDRWTQDDYHGLAAVFARQERGRYVRWTERGSVTNLKTGEDAIPRIPGVRNLDPQTHNAVNAAAWLTSPANRANARAFVNRTWRYLFGRGLIEPTDDLRDSNPASHPVLLEKLTDHFLANGSRLRPLLRVIALSSTYGRSSAVLPGNALDTQFYSHSYPRSLEPEVLADAVADVTGIPNVFPGHPPDTRAVTLTDPLTPAPALDILGRCSRMGTACDDAVMSLTGLVAQLHLINGEFLNQKLAQPNNRLHLMIKAHANDTEIVQEFYLRALSRTANPEELKVWLDRINADHPSDNERTQRFEDFVWSLLNSRQFRVNQ